MHKDLFIYIFSDYIFFFLAVKNEEIHAKQLLRTLTFLEKLFLIVLFFDTAVCLTREADSDENRHGQQIYLRVRG